MNCKITMEIRNLHACPGDRTPKKLKVPKDVFSQIDVTTKTDEINTELAEDRELAQTTEMTRIKIEPLVSFKKDDEDDIIFRLGGSYGKLMGLFREVGGMLYSQKVAGFKSSYKPFLKSLFIKPQWATLEDVSNIEVATIPQITAGRNQSLIIQYYEVIPRCTATIDIQLPENEKAKFQRLIETCEGVPFGPKRRGELKILAMDYVS